VKYFKAYELVDEKTFKEKGETALSLFNPEALQALDDLRDFFGVSIVINTWHSGGEFQWRGYRTPEKAKELGSPNSQHAKGNAFDCDIKGYSAEDARQFILKNKDNPKLKRIMRLEGNVNWVHWDLLQVPDRIHVFKV